MSQPTPPTPDSPRPPKPLVSIIIPHFNDVERLATCLAALAPQIVDAPVEVIVVDNGSSQDMGAVVAAHPTVRFLTERRKGAGPARNSGVAAGTAPCLLFTDADCVPRADWVAVGLILARDLLDGALDADTGIVGGGVAVFDETPPPRSGAEAFETVFAFDQKDYVERQWFSVTANLLTLRRVFDDVGPFDSAASEDKDWCLRARRLGHDIVFRPDLHVSHPTRRDWAALAGKWDRLTREGFVLNGSGPRDRLRWGARGLLVAASGPAHIPRLIRSRDLTWGEVARAAAVLVALRGKRCLWMLRQAATGRD